MSRWRRPPDILTLRTVQRQCAIGRRQLRPLNKVAASHTDRQALGSDAVSSWMDGPAALVGSTRSRAAYGPVEPLGHDAVGLGLLIHMIRGHLLTGQTLGMSDAIGACPERGRSVSKWR